MKTSALAAVAALVMTTSGYAIAQSDNMAGMDHSAMNMEGATGGYMAAMDTMMSSMQGMKLTGDADADFLLMMIPHLQSAIDMAKVELEQGDDEGTRALAQKVIDAQEAEIAEMTALLKAMGVEPPAASN